jgi:hypothetical protein
MKDPGAMTTRKSSVGAILFCLLLGLASRGFSQDAYLADALIEEDGEESGLFQYRLELRRDPGSEHPAPQAALEGEEAGVKLESLFVRPRRDDRGAWDILIRFRAPAEGGWTFPALRVAWPDEVLLIEGRQYGPQADRPRPAGAGAGSDASAPIGRGGPAWLSGPLPAQALGALAAGVLSVEASFEGTKAYSGDMAYLRVRLSGIGRFQDAKAPALRIMRGKGRIRDPRRIPDYDPESGKGSLAFSFPVELSGSGAFIVRLDAYPVYDPEALRLMPGEPVELALEVRDAPAPSPDPRRRSDVEAARTQLKGLPLGALLGGLGAAACLCLALILWRRGGRKAAAILTLGACLCAGLSIRGFAAARRTQVGRLSLAAGTRVFALPADKASSWTTEATEARKLSDYRDESGRSWVRVVLDDGSDGWVIFPGK